VEAQEGDSHSEAVEVPDLLEAALARNSFMLKAVEVVGAVGQKRRDLLFR
jgi:hypothetical protein